MCSTSQNYCNDETNLSVLKFDYEILKTTNKNIKIPRTVKKVVFYLQKAIFFVVP